MSFKIGQVVKLRDGFSPLADPGRARDWSIITDIPRGSRAQVLSIHPHKPVLTLKMLRCGANFGIEHGYAKGAKFTSIVDAWEPV